MKKETFSGTKSILCEVLLIALLLGLTGCATEHPGGSAEGSITAVSAEESQNEGTENRDVSDPAAGMSAGVSEEKSPALGTIEISFDFERMPTHASNQIAIWIEDADGELVKTILVTNFTAARRGYRNRDMAISNWVSAARPESMSDDQIDAISSATPSAGHLTYSWDLTDQNGNRVPDGIYTVYVEGTLYWESNVLFSTSLDTRETEPGELTVERMRSDPDNIENENMLKNVQIFALSRNISNDK